MLRSLVGSEMCIRDRSNTVSAINELESKGIEFVITSGRSPAGIYPILQKNNLISPIIAFGGALILDKNKNALYSKGFSKSIGREVIKAIEESKMDIAWNIYSNDLWIVKSKNDKRIIREVKLVEASNIPVSYTHLTLPTKRIV